MKVYITKLALTEGIIEVDDPEFYGEYICFGRYREFVNPCNWFRTKQEAISRAEEMRVNKIASLMKQIANLESMKFE